MLSVHSIARSPLPQAVRGGVGGVGFPQEPAVNRHRSSEPPNRGEDSMRSLLGQ